MKVRTFIISGLLSVFSIAQVSASNLDLNDQTTKANLMQLAPSKILEGNIEKILGNTHFLKKTQQTSETSKSLEEINSTKDSVISSLQNWLLR